MSNTALLAVSSSPRRPHPFNPEAVMSNSALRRMLLGGTAAAVSLVASTSLLAAEGLSIVPTTTLAGETSNNTSASAALSGNISKSPHNDLLYSGSTTEVYAHFMGWYCSSGHIDVGYCSDDPAQVSKQVADMKSRGITGAILDWYGEGRMSDRVAQLLRAESEAQSFKFAITEDVGSVKAMAATSNCDVTQKVIEDLNYAVTTYAPSPAYMRIDGRPVFFFFGLEAYYVDWNRVRAEVSGNPLLIFRNSGAFTDPAPDGAFAWIALNRANPYDINKAYLDNFYSTSLQHPERITVGVGYPGFNDSIAGWIDNRTMHRNCGRTWLASLAHAANYYSTSRQLRLAQIATFNDYDEGSQMENGIDNCLKVVAWTGGDTLYWALEGDGPPESVSYFRVFVSLDGFNLMKLADVPGTTRSLSLSSWPLTRSTRYKLYVKAIGKASFRTKMSNLVGYRLGNPAPIARLQLSATTGPVPLLVTASTSASTDSDGYIVSSKIDFGDGTIVNGPTASHTYQMFDNYVVRAHVTDNRGTTATTSQQIAVKPATPGVVIQEPAPASNVPNYFRISAYASGANTTTAMKLYVNGESMLTVLDDRFDTYIYLPDGTYTIGVNAWDWTGAVQVRAISVKAGIGANQAPNPVLQLSTLTPAVGATVRACTAASTDPEWHTLKTVVDFGDGTTAVPGATTYHQYQSAGTFVVRATVTDSRGKASTTSTSVAVQ